MRELCPSCNSNATKLRKLLNFDFNSLRNFVALLLQPYISDIL